MEYLVFKITDKKPKPVNEDHAFNAAEGEI